MITVTKGESSATINEFLEVFSNDNQLLTDLQNEVDFANYGNESQLPVLLVLYTNLKANADYSIKVDDVDLKAWKSDDEPNGLIY